MKRRSFPVLPIIRWVIVSVLLVAILATAVLACGELYAKDKLLTEMYNSGILVEIPGYKQNFNQYFTSTDLGTLLAYHNAPVFDSANHDMISKIIDPDGLRKQAGLRSQKDWFREDYYKVIDYMVANTTGEEKATWESYKKWSAVDSLSAYHLYMANYFSDKVQKYLYVVITPDIIDNSTQTEAKGKDFISLLRQYAPADYGAETYVSYDFTNFANPATQEFVTQYNSFRVFVTEDNLEPMLNAIRTNPEFAEYIGDLDESVEYSEMTLAEQIHETDIRYFVYLGIMIAEYFVLLLAFALIREKGRANCFLPAHEKSSTGIPTYICDILSFLTCGLFGVVLFIIEKKSRYAKQMAVQAMMTAILTAIFSCAVWAMFVIFSFMFDPVKNIAQTLKHTVWILTGECYIFGLLMSIFGRSFVLPVVGKLSVNSSYVD